MAFEAPAWLRGIAGRALTEEETKACLEFRTEMSKLVSFGLPGFDLKTRYRVMTLLLGQYLSNAIALNIKYVHEDSTVDAERVMAVVKGLPWPLFIRASVDTMVSLEMERPKT